MINESTIVTNNFRIQAYDSVIGEYFSIGFIEFKLAGKNLLKQILLIFSHQITLKLF